MSVLQGERGFRQRPLRHRPEPSGTKVSFRAGRRGVHSRRRPKYRRRTGSLRPIAHGPPVWPARPATSKQGAPSVSRTTFASRMAPSRDRLDDPASGGPPPGRRPRSGRRARATALLMGEPPAVGLVPPALAGAAVNAPANIISFPSRDFVSATGYDLTKLYTV